MKCRPEVRRLQRLRRHERVRKRVRGTPQRPRLCVFRSNKHISAQIIDDTVGRTLCAVTSTSREVQRQLEGIAGKVEKSRQLGRILAQRAHQLGITKVVFDRGGYRYHGRVKALAEGAREGALLEF